MTWLSMRQVMFLVTPQKGQYSSGVAHGRGRLPGFVRGAFVHLVHSLELPVQ